MVLINICIRSLLIQPARKWITTGKAKEEEKKKGLKSHRGGKDGSDGVRSLCLSLSSFVFSLVYMLLFFLSFNLLLLLCLSLFLL